jgi:hypothetical protein
MQSVKDYLDGPFSSIPGWCGPHLWQILQPVHEFQQSIGCNLPVAEIGVHCGKFFIGLVKTKQAPKGNFAIDVFDLQQFNLDKSGKGSIERLEKYMEACEVPRESIEILRSDSLSLSEETLRNIEQTSGTFSLFSIDGCHTAEHTIHDTRVAMRLTASEGVIMVDDYQNASWPGVQEGVAKLFFTDTPKFLPLLYTTKKLFLAHISYHATYLELVVQFLKKNHPETAIKRVRRFGYDSLTIAPDAKNGRALV